MGKGQIPVIAKVIGGGVLLGIGGAVAFLSDFSTIAANGISIYDWINGKTTPEPGKTPGPAPTTVPEVVHSPTKNTGLDLPLSTAGEEWQVTDPAAFDSMAGRWCSTLGMVRLDLRPGRARYKMEPNGRGWVPSETWKFRQTLRLEPKGLEPLFFTHDGPDHLRQVTRGDDGLNQITRTSDILLWNCDRCLIEDSGLLTWCKGDREYDIIHNRRVSEGRSDLPRFIDVENMQTDASVLLGHDTL